MISVSSVELGPRDAEAAHKIMLGLAQHLHWTPDKKPETHDSFWVYTRRFNTSKKEGERVFAREQEECQQLLRHAISTSYPSAISESHFVPITASAWMDFLIPGTDKRERGRMMSFGYQIKDPKLMSLMVLFHEYKDNDGMIAFVI
jgi:hypothetical protein